MKKSLATAFAGIVLTVSMLTVPGYVPGGRDNYKPREDSAVQASPATVQAVPAILSVCPSLQIVGVTPTTIGKIVGGSGGDIIMDNQQVLQITTRNNSEIGVYAYQLTMVSNNGKDHTRRGHFGGSLPGTEVVIAPHATHTMIWLASDNEAPVTLAAAHFIDDHDEGVPQEIDHLRHHMMSLVAKRGGSPAEVKAMHGKYHHAKADCPPCKNRFVQVSDTTRTCWDTNNLGYYRTKAWNIYWLDGFSLTYQPLTGNGRCTCWLQNGGCPPSFEDATFVNDCSGGADFNVQVHYGICTGDLCSSSFSASDTLCRSHICGT